MMPVLEIFSTCVSCDNCRVLCPENAILAHDNTYSIEQFACTLCGLCIEVCPVDCIKIIEKDDIKVV